MALDFTKTNVPVIIKTWRDNQKQSGVQFKTIVIKQRPSSKDAKVMAWNGAINKILQHVCIQPTIGAMLKVAGVEHYIEKGYDVQTAATQDVLLALRDNKYISHKAYLTLWYALKGYPDEGLLPPGGLASLGLILAGLVTIPVGGAYLVATGAGSFIYDLTKETIQDKTQYEDYSLQNALDEVAAHDGAAADLLTQVIKVRSEIFAQTEYLNNFVALWAKKIWKGFLKLIKVIAEGTAAAIEWAAETAGAVAAGLVGGAAGGFGAMIPWYVKAGVAGVALLILYTKVRPAFMTATSGSAPQSSPPQQNPRRRLSR